MPTSFEVIFLGTLPLIDTTQGNEVAENAAGILGTYGSGANPLYNNVQFLTAERLSEDENETYDTDNGGGFDSFRINGGAPQNFDAIAVYDAVITYLDGSTATITAVVFQDVSGNTYLAPEITNNADQAALTAGPIVSLSLNTIVSDSGDMFADRFAGDFITPVDGTPGNDNMNLGSGFTDAQGDQITTGNDYIIGGDGNDTINADAGNDTVLGGAGNDIIDDWGGNDLVFAGSGADRVDLSLGNDTIFMEDGDDTVRVWDNAGNNSLDGGSGDDLLDFNNFQSSTGATVSVGSDGSGSFSHFSGATTGTFTGFETISGTAFDDRMVASSNTSGIGLSGEAGNDLLIGGAGQDQIDGGTGADTVYGNGGADNISGGDGNDRIFGDNTPPETVVVNNGDFSTNNSSGWTTTGIGTFVYDESMAFNANDFTTYGGTVQQIIATQIGLAYELSLDAFEFGPDSFSHTLLVEVLDSTGQVIGSQTVVIANGASQNITVDFIAQTSDTTLRFTNPTSTGSNDSDLKIDNITVTATPALVEGDDTIDAGAGNDFVDAGGGDDSVSGGTGDDTIGGGAGDDSLTGGDGNDRIFGDNLTPAPVNVINGDFATNDTTGWTTTGPGTFVYDQFMAFNAANTAAGGTAQQTVATEVGVEYQLSFNAFETGSAIASHTLRVDVIDANGTVIGTQTIVVANGSSQLVTVDFTATTANTTLRFSNPNSSGVVNTDLGIDNVTVTAFATPTTTGNDTINAGEGSDFVDAGDGDDLVIVDGTFAGNDTLDGGAGNDTLALLPDDNRNLTVDMVAGGVADGMAGAQEFSNFENVITGGGNDSVTGTSGANFISTQGGNDTVQAGDGNDTVEGGDGNDSLLGGAGDDSILGGAGNDTIVGGSPETIAGPNLIVNGSFEAGVPDNGWQYFSNGTLPGWQSDSGIVEVHGNLFANNTAADGSNWAEIDADNAVDNIYQDVTTPAGESLTLIFEAQQRTAGDTQSIEVWFGGVLIDTITPATNSWQTYSYTVTGSGTDRLEFRELSTENNSFGPLIDNVSLTAQVIASSDDTLSGGDGDDQILGEGGDDLLLGDAGNDSLSGGSGDDTLFGGDGDDTLIAGNNTGAGDSLSGGAGVDYLVDSFWNATLDGGTGSDLFELGYGNATVIGGEDVGNTDSDLIDFQVANDAVNILYSGDEAGTYTDSDGDSGQFSQIEAIILTDNADTVNATADSAGVVLIGNDGNDLLTGGQGDDFIEGGADNDSIAGGAGNDTLNGGSGQDTIFGGDGADSINSGSGNDTVDGEAGNDQIDGSFGDDLLTGGEGNDTLLGGSGNDTIDGGAGDDLLVTGSYGGAFATSNDAGGNTNVVSGGDGNDTILASVGADTLSGDAGDDSIDGQGGNDVITGGDGRDTLQGGAGADTLTGGTGADVFVVDDGGDIITDFDTTTGIQGGGTPDQTDNDFVDLSAFYNETTLAAWNAANPTNTYLRPIDWLRADHADDGALAEVGGLQIRGADGQPVDANQLTFENTNVVCFANGTRIATAKGAVKVEDLVPGDLVMTMDHGLQPLRWVGSRRLDMQDFRRNPNLRPIRLSAAALGMADLTGDLLVSPQHRIMMASPIVQRMFDCSEVLIAAKDLLQIAGVTLADDVSSLSYHHLLFDDHEIVFANGIPAESLYLGKEARKALSPEGLAEIYAIFPQIATPHFTPLACRPMLSGKRARKLSWRHAHNRKPLIDPRMTRGATDDAMRAFLG